MNYHGSTGRLGEGGGPYMATATFCTDWSVQKPQLLPHGTDNPMQTGHNPNHTPPTEATSAPQSAEHTPEGNPGAETTPQAAVGELSQRFEALPPNAIRHPACGQWWTGLSRAHCPACCRTFSTDSAANKHRIGKHGVDRRCVDPAEVGLVANEKPYGTLWSLPAPEGGYAFHASRQDESAVAEHEETVRIWNSRHPIGTPVVAYPGVRPEGSPSASRLVTKTRSSAEVLGGHTPVVWVDGHEARIALTHIDVIEEAPRG